ncbi:uncharacterized protein RCC_05334 [Ramularia collo-cygni]|uniref:Uncharacterized protein n=1 Tax=Ramularia collo-cygni TaxID=112498 RepID=A0A2D3VFT2_9PEZI|nr:uncharacterized protein RCC_05334 [Ramularia collo-cygni]CZT19483.1 uncharacterized protein RCC_05334 [Ramularia collo-cygni]
MQQAVCIQVYQQRERYGIYSGLWITENDARSHYSIHLCILIRVSAEQVAAPFLEGLD